MFLRIMERESVTISLPWAVKVFLSLSATLAQKKSYFSEAVVKFGFGLEAVFILPKDQR